MWRPAPPVPSIQRERSPGGMQSVSSVRIHRLHFPLHVYSALTLCPPPPHTHPSPPLEMGEGNGEIASPETNQEHNQKIAWSKRHGSAPARRPPLSAECYAIAGILVPLRGESTPLLPLSPSRPPPILSFFHPAGFYWLIAAYAFQNRDVPLAEPACPQETLTPGWGGGAPLS